MVWQDPIVEEVRRTREALSAAFNYDVQAIFADLRARQTEVGDRLIGLSPEVKPVPFDSQQQCSKDRN